MPTPNEIQLTDFEARHLEALRQGQWLFGFTNLQRLRTDSYRLLHNVFRRFESNVASKSLRSACILYSLYHHREIEGNRESDVQHYLVEFYKNAQKAITRQAYGELVYSCFAMCMYSVRTGRNTTEILHHADGFRKSVASFVLQNTLDTEEMFLLECMWEKMVWYIARLVLSQPFPMVELFPRLEPYCQPLSLANYNDGQSSWMQHSYCEIKAKFDFVRVTLLILANPEHTGIAQFLTRRFYRDMRMSPIGRPIQWFQAQERFSGSVLATMWSELFGLIGGLLGGGEETTAEHVFSILNFIHSIESNRATEVVDMIVCVLVLVCLVANQKKDYPQLGMGHLVWC